jgi:DNA-binding CsgD family transcriptional regulator
MKTITTNIQRCESGYQLGHLVAQNLPPQQSQVLLMRASGMPHAQCAQVLGCSLSNIRNIVTTLFYKLHANSSPELITRAFENNYLRFLSLFFAVLLGCLGNTLTDQSIARTGRPTAARTQRTQRKEGEPA